MGGGPLGSGAGGGVDDAAGDGLAQVLSYHYLGHLRTIKFVTVHPLQQGRLRLCVTDTYFILYLTTV